jgi:hypothetical protein
MDVSSQWTEISAVNFPRKLGHTKIFLSPDYMKHEMQMPALIRDFMLPFRVRNKLFSFKSAHVAVCQGQIRVQAPIQGRLTSSRLQYQQGGVRMYEVFTKLVRFGFDSCIGIGNFTSVNVAV